MKTIVWRFQLFFGLLWREWEPKGFIPEQFRIRYRIPMKEAWRIAKSIHPLDW